MQDPQEARARTRFSGAMQAHEEMQMPKTDGRTKEPRTLVDELDELVQALTNAVFEDSLIPFAISLEIDKDDAKAEERDTASTYSAAFSQATKAMDDVDSAIARLNKVRTLLVKAHQKDGRARAC